MPVSTLGGPGKFAETPQCQVTSRSPSTCPRPARYAGEFPGWRSLLPMRPLPLPAIASHVGCLVVSRHLTLGVTFFYHSGRLVATRKEEERSTGTGYAEGRYRTISVAVPLGLPCAIVLGSRRGQVVPFVNVAFLPANWPHRFR